MANCQIVGVTEYMRWILLICLVFASCSILKTDLSDVKEITWRNFGENTGKQLITFRSDGTAEKSAERYIPGSAKIVERSRATVTPEQVRRLAETLAAHGFFTKEDHPTNDLERTITVTTSSSKRELSVLFGDDPDNVAMTRAVHDLENQLTWEPVQN